MGPRIGKCSAVGSSFSTRSTCRRLQFDSWVRKIRWRRERLFTPVFLGFPCGSAGKICLYSPRDQKESDPTERLSLSLFQGHTAEKAVQEFTFSSVWLPDSKDAPQHSDHLSNVAKTYPWLLFSHPVVSDSLWPHRLQHTRLPCPSASLRACSNSCPLSG